MHNIRKFANQTLFDFRVFRHTSTRPLNSSGCLRITNKLNVFHAFFWFIFNFHFSTIHHPNPNFVKFRLVISFLLFVREIGRCWLVVIMNVNACQMEFNIFRQNYYSFGSMLYDTMELDFASMFPSFSLNITNRSPFNSASQSIHLSAQSLLILFSQFRFDFAIWSSTV